MNIDYMKNDEYIA